MRTATLFLEQGADPEIPGLLQRVFDAAGARIRWEVAAVDRTIRAALLVPRDPAAVGEIRSALDLFARIRPGRMGDADLVVIDGDASTPETARRLAHAAFHHAAMRACRRITLVHDPGDGAPFLKTALDVARDYPQLRVDDEPFAVAIPKLFRTPEEYDLLLSHGAGGRILADLPVTAAEIHAGEGAAVFAPVPSSGTGTALLPAAALLLEHLNEHQACDRLRRALAAGADSVLAALGVE